LASTKLEHENLIKLAGKKNWDWKWKWKWGNATKAEVFDCIIPCSQFWVCSDNVNFHYILIYTMWIGDNSIQYIFCIS